MRHCLAFFFLLPVAACSTAGPKQPFTYRKTWSANQPKRILTYSYLPPGTQEQPYFKTAFEKAKKEGEGREVRNQILFELMGMVDDYYYKNTVNLRDTVIGKNLFVSLTGIGTSLAASLAGGEQMKTVLSAISTGVQTFNASIDKEVFLNNTVQAVRFQMDANRATVAKEMATKMEGGAANYPLEAGLRDIIAYYDAGTVTSALSSLAAQAADKKRTEERDAAKAQERLAGIDRGVEDSRSPGLDD